MAQHPEKEDEGISVTKEDPFELHLEAQKRKPKHTDPKSLVKETILEMEKHSLSFTREEIIEHSKEHHVSESNAEEAIDELIRDGWLHGYEGTNMLSRTVWRDYSPAFEEYPEY